MSILKLKFIAVSSQLLLDIMLSDSLDRSLLDDVLS
jgi:hypothetical protein